MVEYLVFCTVFLLDFSYIFEYQHVVKRGSASIILAIHAKHIVEGLPKCFPIDRCVQSFEWIPMLIKVGKEVGVVEKTEL